MSFPLRYKCPVCGVKKTLYYDTITLNRAKHDEWERTAERNGDGRYLITCAECDLPRVDEGLEKEGTHPSFLREAIANLGAHLERLDKFIASRKGGA